MDFSWQKRKAPPIGLQKQKLGYHLHEQIRRDSSAEREQAEADVFGPPRTDSDEESSSPLPNSPLKPASSPPAKRRRLNTRSSQQIHQTNPSHGKKEPDLADIPRTVFTTSNSTSDDHSNANGNRVPSSTSQSQTVVKDDPDHLFQNYKAFQSKKGKTYGRAAVNFHKAAPVEPEKEQARTKYEKNKSMIKRQPDGFRVVDTDAFEALVPSPEKRHVQAGFKRPAGLSPSPRSERASRRSTQEEAKALRPARQKTFKKPVPVPTSPKRESPPPSRFKVPKGLSPNLDDRQSSTSNRPSQDASMPDAPIAPRLKDLQGFANNLAITARTKLDLDIPESSVAVSPGPTFDFDVGDGSSTSSLSSAPAIEELDALDFHDQVLKAHPPSSPKSKCPLCKELVSRLFQEEFFCSGNLNVRQQAMFCTAHKKRSAQEVWRKRGYPCIEWNEFQGRLPKYEDAMIGVLNRTRRSFYRNVLEDQLKSGKRTAKQLMMVGDEQQGLKMGYYGTKGQQILMDYLMSRFASRIRRLAGTDRLVSAAGVAGFVQGVLAPELVVMLVKDDMNVDEEQARVILEESSEIGNLVNEEEDEVIKDEVVEDV
ncbi:hypothetical protein XPA_001171 [Xanthoria parietina]